MKLKFTALLAVLILLPAVLFALPVVVTWEWLLEDPEVTTFRFQVDSEDPAGWITVDSTVTSYTERGLDGTLDHTLYLQQSYDGINFSESTRSVAEAFDTPEVEVIAQAAPEVVATPVPVQEAPKPVAVAPMAPKAIKASRFYTTLGINLGYNYQRELFNASYDNHNIKTGIALEFHNIVSFGKIFGLGVDLDLDYTPYLGRPSTYEDLLADLVKFKFDGFSTFFGNLEHSFTASPAVMLNLEGKRLGLSLGAGGFFTYSLDDNFLASGDAYRYGVFAKVGLAYRVTDHFRLGVNAKYGHDLDGFKNAGNPFGDASLVLGFVL